MHRPDDGDLPPCERPEDRQGQAVVHKIQVRDVRALPREQGFELSGGLPVPEHPRRVERALLGVERPREEFRLAAGQVSRVRRRKVTDLMPRLPQHPVEREEVGFGAAHGIVVAVDQQDLHPRRLLRIRLFTPRAHG